MNLKSQRRIAADIMKCGVGRVKITESKEVEEALTRNDIRRLIVRGAITKAPFQGMSSAGKKKLRLQKKRGRRGGRGSRKGSKGARRDKKENWIRRVRALRKTLRELRDSKRIEVRDYRSLYMRVKGNAFRNKKHLLGYLKEQEILKTKGSGKTKPVKTAGPASTGRSGAKTMAETTEQPRKASKPLKKAKAAKAKRAAGAADKGGKR